MLILLLSLALLVNPSSEDDFKGEMKRTGKEIGQGFKRGGKAIGRATKKGRKAVGQSAKTAGKGIAKGAKEAKEVGKGLKESLKQNGK